MLIGLKGIRQSKFGCLSLDTKIVSGGGCEIRTHGEVAPSLVFKTSAFDHSANPPGVKL